MAEEKNTTKGEEVYVSRFLIVRPENCRLVDVFRFLLSEDGYLSAGFLESSGESLEQISRDHRWIIIFSLIIRWILRFIGKPMGLVGMWVEFLLNLLSENGGILGLIANVFNGKVVIPQRNSSTFMSAIGHLDRRVDLCKGELLRSLDEESSDPQPRNFNIESKAILDLCIMASKLAYENENVIRNIVNNHWKMHFVEFYNCWDEFQKERATQVIILTDKPKDANLILISFRGTEPFDADDWSTDFDYSWYEIPPLGKVHMGFLEALGLGNRAKPSTFLHHLLYEEYPSKGTKDPLSSSESDAKSTKHPSEGTEGQQEGSELDSKSTEYPLEEIKGPSTEVDSKSTKYPSRATEGPEEGSELDSKSTKYTPEASKRSQNIWHGTSQDEDKVTAYYTVRRKLKSLLEEHTRAKFIVTGHSLGGALAILFPAILLLHKEEEVMERLLGVNTFGQPRVGDRQLGRFMEAHLNKPVPRYFRVVYCNDLVPRLPYDNKTFLFKHFGVCLYYNSCYMEKSMEEEPNRNYFGFRYLIPEYLNYAWELIRSLTMGYIEGPDYKEGWLSILFRALGLALPGFSEHAPTDYINSVRLGRESPTISSL